CQGGWYADPGASRDAPQFSDAAIVQTYLFRTGRIASFSASLSRCAGSTAPPRAASSFNELMVAGTPAAKCRAGWRADFLPWRGRPAAGGYFLRSLSMSAGKRPALSQIWGAHGLALELSPLILVLATVALCPKLFQFALELHLPVQALPEVARSRWLPELLVCV